MVRYRAGFASVRLPLDLAERLEQVADRMTERAGGLRVPLASLLVILIRKGLPLHEAELGIASPPEGTPTR